MFPWNQLWISKKNFENRPCIVCQGVRPVCSWALRLMAILAAGYRYVCRPALWRFWNHREVHKSPSSNNRSVLRGEAFPPLTQHSFVPQPTKHLSARLRGRAGDRRGRWVYTHQLVGFSVDRGSVGIGWSCLSTQPPAAQERLCTVRWQVCHIIQ